tara:strand:+ start:3829 stop:4707 length:879 start_codon:yes stop_codon:yes gene_type:complete
MEVNLIKKENLNNVISFLAKGFYSSNFNSYQVKRFLKKANCEKIDFFGFYLSNSNNLILGAILTPLQGKYFSRQKELNVISLMAWYVLPKYRGMESIRLAKFAINYLDSRNFIITNFTPNKVAKKIFNNFGFKNMDILTARFYWFEGYKHFLFFLFKKYHLRRLSLNTKYFSFRENYKGDLSTYKINYKNKKIIFKAKRTIRKKKIFGLQISYPVLYITPLTNLKFINENIEFFSSLISYYFFVLFIEIDLEKKYLDNKNKFHKRFKSRYLIYSKNKLIRFIPFFGSELVMK